MTEEAPTSHCTLCSEPDAARLLGRKCPRCDRGLGEPLDRRFVDIDTGNVRADVRCVECGYNLRTLHVTALCPECGRLVLDSLTARELVFADTKWLRCLRSGMTLLIGAHVGWIVTLLGVMFLFLIAPRLGWTPQATDELVRTLLEASLVVFAIGIWRVTKQEPLRANDRDGQLLRWTTRILGISPAVLLGPWPKGWLLALPWPVGHAWDDGQVSLLAWVGVFLSLALSLYHVGRLSARGRRSGLRKAARTGIVLLACTGTGLALVLQAGPSGNMTLETTVLIALAISYLLSLIVFIACRRMLSSVIRRSIELNDGSSSQPFLDDGTTRAAATPSE